MPNKTVIDYMLNVGYYMRRSMNFSGRFGFMIYTGNQNPVMFCTNSDAKFIKNLLKEDSHQRLTLNLSAVRQLHGSSLVKKAYKNHKRKAPALTRTEQYVRACFSYGVITLCYMIEEYAKEENFEECQIILDAINIISKMIGEEVPTHFDDKAKRWLRLQLIPFTETDGSVIINNLPLYAEHIKNKLK